MTIRAAELQVVIGADDRQARGVLQGFSSFLGGVASTASGFLSAQIFQGAITGAQQLGREALTAYANYERLGMSLESLVGRELMNAGAADSLREAMETAGPAAQELLGWIQQLAIESPFTQQGVADAYRTAMAYGFTSKEAKRLTQAMIDFSAGSGANEATMSRIALALGQIQSKGKLAGQEMLQLTEAGLPVTQILSKAFGVTTGELEKMREKGLIPADKAIEAIVQSLEQDFGGAAERQAATFSGLISSLTDIKEVGLRELFTGVFQEAQPYVAAVVDKLSSEEFKASLREAGMRAGELVRPFLDGSVAKNVQDFVSSLITPDMTESINSFRESLGALGGTIEESLPMLEQYGADMKRFLVEQLQTAGPEILGNLSSVVASIEEIWRNHGDEIMAVVNFAWRVITTVVLGAMELLTGGIAGFLAWMQGLFDAATLAVQGNWQGAWEAILLAALNAFGLIQGAAEAFFGLVLGIVGTNMEAFKLTWSENWEMAKLIVTTIWQNIVSRITDKVNEIYSVVASKLAAVIEWIGTKFVEPMKRHMDAVQKAIKPVIDALGALIEMAKNPIEIFTTVVTKTIGVGGNKGGSFGGISNPILKGTGGFVSAGQATIVGERGEPELFVPSQSGRIYPMNKLSVGSGSVEIYGDIHVYQERGTNFLEALGYAAGV